MPTISIYLEDETQKKAERMRVIEERSMSNLISLLINAEWRRNFQSAERKHLLQDASPAIISSESIPPEDRP